MGVPEAAVAGGDVVGVVRVVGSLRKDEDKWFYSFEVCFVELSVIRFLLNI